MFAVSRIAPSFFAICFIFFTAIAAVLNAQTGRGTSKAAQWPSQEPVASRKIKGEIYLVTGGSGANTGFFIGEKEVVAVDAKMTEESAKDMIAEIRKRTPNPVRYVLLTHSDRDHVNGLSAFPRDATVVSHENTRKDMDAAFKEENLRAHLPAVTFPDRATLFSGYTQIELFFFGPAHTSGDVVVLFPGEKVAFVGDLLTVGRDPLVHLAKNGSSYGLVKDLKSILELDADTFLSGHSGVAGRAEIEAEIRSVEEKQVKIKALVDQGKTLDEVKKALGVEEGPMQPGQFRFMSLPEVIYRELTEKR
jgi:cyclase